MSDRLKNAMFVFESSQDFIFFKIILFGSFADKILNIICRQLENAANEKAGSDGFEYAALKICKIFKTNEEDSERVKEFVKVLSVFRKKITNKKWGRIEGSVASLFISTKIESRKERVKNRRALLSYEGILY